MKEVTGPRKRGLTRSDSLPWVLYVEDDPDNWAVTELRLSRRFHLLWARSDVEACALLRKHAPELCAVLMDIELKGSSLSGIELTSAFRGSAAIDRLPDFARGLPLCSAPIFFVTAHASRYQLPELKDLGASRVIPKPVNFAELSLALSEVQLESEGQKGSPGPLSVDRAERLRAQLDSAPEEALERMMSLARLPLLGGTGEPGRGVLRRLSPSQLMAVAALVELAELAPPEAREGALVENALRRAAAAALVSKELKAPHPLEAALVGAMLEAGLLARSRHDRRGALEVAQSPARWRTVLERASGEVEHPARSGQVARRWGAPAEWIEAIERHHDALPPDSGLGRLTWLVERMAGVFEAGDPAQAYVEALASANEARLPRNAVERALQTLPGALLELAQAGGWTLSAGEPLERLLLQSNPSMTHLFRSYEQLTRALTLLATEKDGLVERLTEANEELARAAGTDALTGLANQRAFLQALRRTCALAARNGSQVSLILLDLDHFKNVNDTWGHPAGDEVLRAVGKAVQGQLRESDFGARCGGEELGFILPETPLDYGYEVAERLRKAVEGLVFPGRLEEIRVTASLGVACARSEQLRQEVDLLVAEADRALYAAKAQGRNRCVSASALAPLAR